jgi:UDP-N-acetylmuramoyl-L-alanyl-D-glutamate--2,6-diaminopimelate ligase
MERIRAGQEFLVLVDYAHTPDAVARAIAASRDAALGEVIVVLGCGGDRDKDKRPVMGEVAARDADVLIVTDDNPRSEPPSQIRAAIMEGARRVAPADRAVLHDEGERRDAISRAVRMAGPSDCVLLLGKGHEQGQEVAGVVTPFDDRLVVREALEALG